MRKVLMQALVALGVVLFPSNSYSAQEDVFSPTTAESFLNTAIDLYSAPDATVAQAKQAMVFIDAISVLEPSRSYVLPEAVKLAWKFPQIDFSDTIHKLLIKYSDEKADLEIARLAVQYVVDRLNYRENREKYYADMLKIVGTRNKTLGSELATQLGLLALEKGDRQAAEFYLMQAYNGDVYNKVAFEALTEVSGKPMPADLYIRHLRMMLNADPYDIEAAFAFSNNAYAAGIYGIAATGFEYCSALFKHLHPSEPLPFSIYRPWAFSCLNDTKKMSDCLKIAQDVRTAGKFDLVLEAIAGTAAQKLGNTAQANDILGAAATKAQQIVEQSANSNLVRAQDIAWFYCFGKPDPNKALEWANVANSQEPNSVAVNSILAYALVINGQNEAAAPLAAEFADKSQIAALARGMAEMTVDPNSSLSVIKNAVAVDPGNLESLIAKAYLEQNGSTYVAPQQSAAIAKALQTEFGENVINGFVTADKLFSAKLSAVGTDFAYGSSFNANLVITNKSSDPMVIFDDGLFKGVIRVDAAVTGDLKENIQNLILIKFRPSLPVPANQSAFVPLRLITGSLRKLLIEHPQANLKVEFTAYLDPVVDANGNVQNGFASIAPLKLTIAQSPVNISGPYLQNRLNALATGRPGQKIMTARLFSGLLLEYYNTAGKKTYRKRDIEPQLLRSAIVKCLQDEDWSVKVETTLGLSDIQLDYQLQEALSTNLTDSFWPVRMTSLWVLGRNPSENFKKVLDWTAANDSGIYVVNTAVALGAKAPKPQVAPAQSHATRPKDQQVEPAMPTITDEPVPADQNAVPDVQPAVSEPVKTQEAPVTQDNNELPASEPNTTAVTEPNVSSSSIAELLKETEPNAEPNGL